MPIYKRYRDMGGRYITIGSDAHTEENIGMNFKVALDLAEHLNLQPVHFKNRKIEI
jgi:histidinol-phosphatase (PHP family)